jgi:predicted phage tail protein
MMKYLDGSGGIVGGGKGSSNSGGSESRSPIEAPNSLISKDYARLIGVISEGQIAGQVSDNILKDIFLDDRTLFISYYGLFYL